MSATPATRANGAREPPPLQSTHTAASRTYSQHRPSLHAQQPRHQQLAHPAVPSAVSPAASLKSAKAISLPKELLKTLGRGLLYVACFCCVLSGEEKPHRNRQPPPLRATSVPRSHYSAISRERVPQMAQVPGRINGAGRTTSQARVGVSAPRAVSRPRDGGVLRTFDSHGNAVHHGVLDLNGASGNGVARRNS